MRPEGETSSGGGSKATEQKNKPEPPKDYIHVRARRGQATDRHSLAERVILLLNHIGLHQIDPQSCLFSITICL